MTWYDTNLVLIQATITGLLLALSVQVPFRMGVFSFAGAGAYGIGCYGGAILVLDYEMGALPTILLCTIGGASVVLVLGLLIYRLNGLYLAMATVAFDLIISVIAINGGDWTGGSTGRYGVITDFTMAQMFTIGIGALVLVAMSELGRTGRRVNAVRDDPELAASMGIQVRRYRLVAFLVSGALGGCAGCLNILVRSAVSPLDIGFPLIVLALTMIIVGGSLSWKGAVIGAVIFTFLPDVLQVVGQWQELIYGIIVAVAAVLLPRGIYGLYVDTKRAVLRWQRRRSGTEAAAVAAEEAREGDEPPPLVNALNAPEGANG
jgi:branched-chain amino acid transport system permease protein